MNSIRMRTILLALTLMAWVCRAGQPTGGVMGVQEIPGSYVFSLTPEK